MASIISSIAHGMGRRIALAYRLGGRTLLLAPLIVTPAMLTEAAQHVAEIHLGMFASREAFRGLAMDPTRWAFGYGKLAGFLFSILLTARFWAIDGAWTRMPEIGWRSATRLSLGLVASIVLVAIQRWFDRQGTLLSMATNLVDFLVSTGLTLYMVGALFGEEQATIRWSFTKGWPRAVTMTLLAITAFVPCQLLHLLDHRVAIGAPLPVVWLAMLWDSLFVGLFAALVGTTLFVGFRYGPDWRGWDRPLPARG